MTSTDVVDLACRLQFCHSGFAFNCCEKHATQYTPKTQDRTFGERLSASKSEEECVQTDSQTDMHLSQPQQGCMLIVCHHAASKVQDALEA